MAVVQISRIQHRRGRKNQGTGIPTLASGELGWAIDAQELYIGNGAVSEGAPTVGNTRILTEKDDLLELAGQYAYKRDINFLTGVDTSNPIERTLQQKLDDTISLLDFLPAADREELFLGRSLDVTVTLQRAVDQLFINNTTKGSYVSRIVLRVPAGSYILTAPIYLPPFANIVGEGKGKTYFIAQGAHAFYTKNETSTPGVYADDSTTDLLNQARQITLKDFTVLHTSYGGTLRLESCRDSEFENIEFLGQWQQGDGIGVDYTAIKMNALSTAVSTNNNTFKNCTFEGFVYPVYSDFDIYYNKFITGKIDNCGYGFVFGLGSTIGSVGQATGPMHNNIQHFDFTNIDRQGIIIDNGQHNRSESNRFIAVGNDGGNSSNATYSIIRFGERSNISENDYFERTQDLAPDPRLNIFSIVSYPPEVEGPKDFYNKYEVTTSIGEALTQEDLIQLPADQLKGMIELNYHYRCDLSTTDDVLRKGKLTIIYDKTSSKISLADDYTAIGNPTKITDLEFYARLVANRILLDVINTTLDDVLSENDEFVFTIRHVA
jgi:hypothetical protein